MLPARARILAGLLKRIGTFNPESFGTSFLERLRVQKIVYLMQHGFGVNLGYIYNWYIHGPYSPDLARDAFALVADYASVPIQRFTDTNLENQFKRFEQFIERHKDDPDWLTIGASILYLYKNVSKDKGYIFQTLAAKGLPETRFSEVWEELTSWSLLG